MRGKLSRGGVVVAVLIGTTALGIGAAQAAGPEVTGGQVGLGCGEIGGYVDATGLAPDAFARLEYGSSASGGQTDADGNVTFALNTNSPGSAAAGDAYPVRVLQGGAVVAEGSVVLDDLCSGTGTYSATRDCASPGTADVAVSLRGGPADTGVAVILIFDGVVFANEDLRGNAAFEETVRADAAGDFTGTIRFTNNPDVAFEERASRPTVMTLAPDYNYSSVLTDQEIDLPACTTAPDAGTPDSGGQGSQPPVAGQPAVGGTTTAPSTTVSTTAPTIASAAATSSPTVVAAGGAGRPAALAATGSPVDGMVVLGGVLVAAGAGLVLVERRRARI